MTDTLIRLAIGEKTAPIRVGRIPSDVARKLGCAVQTVYISEYSIRKQFIRHRDFRAEWYEHLEWMITNGEIIYDNKDRNVVHFVSDCRDMTNFLVKATVKATKRKHELWLTSVHKFRDRDHRRLLRRSAENAA